MLTTQSFLKLLDSIQHIPDGAYVSGVLVVWKGEEYSVSVEGPERYRALVAGSCIAGYGRTPEAAIGDLVQRLEMEAKTSIAKEMEEVGR